MSETSRIKLLYELFTGQVPYPAWSANGSPRVLMEVLAAHLNEPVPRLSRQRPGLPGELDDIVSRCLSKSPAQRPGSVALVSGLLEAAAKTLDAGQSRTVEGQSLLSGIAGSPGACTASTVGAPLTRLLRSTRPTRPVVARPEPAALPPSGRPRWTHVAAAVGAGALLGGLVVWVAMVVCPGDDATRVSPSPAMPTRVVREEPRRESRIGSAMDLLGEGRPFTSVRAIESHPLDPAWRDSIKGLEERIVQDLRGALKAWCMKDPNQARILPEPGRSHAFTAAAQTARCYDSSPWTLP